MWKKLQVRKGKLFSTGGREVLFKVMALDIPIYTVSVFRIPSLLCKDLHAMVARFWWEGSVERRKLHWKNWEMLCPKKEDGGMVLRDFGVFNQAMLAQQC